MSISGLIGQEDFFHYFQPIYVLETNQPLGFEALFRTSHYSNPEFIFNTARKLNRLYELDSRSIHKAVSAYQRAGFLKEEQQNLFVNIFPSTILNPRFSSFLNKIIAEFKLTSQQIILEISEAEYIPDLLAFKKQVDAIKAKGFQIALDDIGHGYFTFESIIELHPNFIKLDRYLSGGLHVSKQKQTVVSNFVSYCHDNEIALVLEGLEDEREVDTAKSLGINLAQGYYLGKPEQLKWTV
ncbi:EAL domain-containing protein [Aquibacillus salsiterrae]|uniref:EAL domain-containing protein n=1 Tax=Aquibacillus salsiterrae TaxID=2950439 RepID=A0A9X3WAV6_9BACI|nr:EAL domain-containing protein [Aquibacillus salsiterrae]MDC3415982.1 EAL domain-containing protein [Aquibacillus salsiterrae]